MGVGLLSGSWSLRCILPVQGRRTQHGRRGHGFLPLAYCACSVSILKFVCIITVEPPKKGHFGNSTFVLSSEVVLISEVHEIF